MLKEEIAILKEHIHIKRKQVTAYQEMLAPLSLNDLMIQVDFAERYKNWQHDAIQSPVFGISILTACCYFNAQGKIKNDNVIVATERSGHDRVASI